MTPRRWGCDARTERCTAGWMSGCWRLGIRLDGILGEEDPVVAEQGLVAGNADGFESLLSKSAEARLLPGDQRRTEVSHLDALGGCRRRRWARPGSSHPPSSGTQFQVGHDPLDRGELDFSSSDRRRPPRHSHSHPHTHTAAATARSHGSRVSGRGRRDHRSPAREVARTPGAASGAVGLCRAQAQTGQEPASVRVAAFRRFHTLMAPISTRRPPSCDSS